MNEPLQPSDNKLFLQRVLEATIRIGIVLLLAAWCFQIVQPFIIPVVWGIIIAVAAYPGYHWLQTRLGDRRGVAATLFTLLALALLVVPVLMLGGTLVENVRTLSQGLGDGPLAIPPPPESVGAWPIIGEPLEKFWSLASMNLQAALGQIEPQIKVIGGWLLSAAAGVTIGILQFVVAIVIAAVLMMRATEGRRVSRAIATRLASERGMEFVDLAEATVRNVARGILGVALIQSILAGLGFLAAGVPGAGIWALLCLLFGITQIGIFVILIPVAIYLFSTADMLTSVLFLIWSIPVGLLDNILKPIILSRGLKTPMVIIFTGAIGGFLSAGIIGLFIGAVVLALSYELLLAWLDGTDNPTNSST
ncbi:MAG: AI-2E family transporter [Gammaproteobacteria bacterium]|nr:AI-2E family transporter [Gammaproteobacteria bacterium]